MSLIWTFAKSAIAGAVAGTVMRKIDSALAARQHGASPTEQEESSQDVEEKVVDMVSSRLPVELGDDARDLLTQGAHYGIYGLMSGAPLLLRRQLARDRGAVLGGLLFGAGSYLLIDECLKPALSITDPPTDYPIETHLRGLIAHLAQGVADQATRELLSS